MASTRNKNDKGNYISEQRSLDNSRASLGFANQGNGKAYTNNYAGDGLLMGKMGPAALSYNYIDIDSYLKGTGSTNLVASLAPVEPRFKELESLSIMNRLPVILPSPLQIDANQRPLLR